MRKRNRNDIGRISYLIIAFLFCLTSVLGNISFTSVKADEGEETGEGEESGQEEGDEDDEDDNDDDDD
ncbi:MAG: hypothetical protein IJL20_01510, partial [Lachnospiraceae bacterium]|nr:hypothetical protein [Lachnospiraceae bacterium]